MNGLARTESVTVISDDVFGTISDTINLKSQMAACSFGQLNVIVGNPPTHSVGSNDVVIGGSDIYKSVDRTTYNNYKTLIVDYQEKFKEFLELYNKTNNVNLQINVTDEQLINSPSFLDIVQTFNLVQ